MNTAIAGWGNSVAIRIPKHLLKDTGLNKGDAVNLEVNERGNIEIVPLRTYRVGEEEDRLALTSCLAAMTQQKN